MNDLKFNAVLSASFAAALTVACYPLTAPVISCVFDSFPVDWLSWLDSIGLDMWSAFWLSGAWLGHIPFMFAAFCLLFLFLLGYVPLRTPGGPEASTTAYTATPTLSGARRGSTGLTISGMVAERRRRPASSSARQQRVIGSIRPCLML